jgi:organic hydroperoxide reductase OsmC/OhrA
MSEHKVTIHWSMSGEDFLRGRYSREHTWTFDGGVRVAASPAPSVVPLPYSNPAGVDPEEAFVAALASCHMLTFLHRAQKRGFGVLHYEDEAVGVLTKNERGVPWVSRVVLRPRITFGGERIPTDAEQDALHHEAHAGCFIANSVKSELLVERQRS